MTHSLALLAASWIAGAGEPIPMPVGPTQPYVVQQPAYTAPQAPVYNYPVQYQQPQQEAGFFSRLKSKIGAMFGKKQGCPCSHPQPSLYYQYQNAPPIVPNGEPPLADSTPLQQIGYPTLPAVPELPSVEPVPGQDVDAKFVQKVGHEDDYSWVTGQLHYVRTRSGNVWVVRYATVDTEDKYGGSVVLTPSVSMKNFREGDLVSVKGEILGDAPASRHLGGPLYRVTSIDMIERAD